MDLNLTEHHYKDILLKEINGELTCVNKSNSIENMPMRNRRAGFLPTSGSYQNDLVTWNCTYAAQILSTCYDTFSPNVILENSVQDPDRVKACEIAVSLKKSVDGSMIFLIIIFSCLLNTILQSTIPIFKGKFFDAFERIS